MFKSFGNGAALQSGGTASDTFVSFARWQQGEQNVAGVGVVFYYPLGFAQTSHFQSVPRAFWYLWRFLLL